MVLGFKSVVALHLILLALASRAAIGTTIAAAPAPSVAPGPSPISLPRPPGKNKNLTIIVEGVIFCRSCKLPGYIKAVDGSPLPGVGVRVQCRYGEYAAVKTGKTDSRGYFLVELVKVKTAAIPGCKVYIVSLPKTCSKPFLPVGVKTGVSLKFERFVKERTLVSGLYTAGFIEFAPQNPKVCPRV